MELPSDKPLTTASEASLESVVVTLQVKRRQQDNRDSYRAPKSQNNQRCRDGKTRLNFIASVSKTSAKAFRDKIKMLEIHKKTGCKIDMIAEFLNPMLRGWINYFGKFNPSAMRYTLQCIERRIVKWAMSKYKRFRGHRRRAEKWLESVRKREPKLFAHWSRLYTYC